MRVLFLVLATIIVTGCKFERKANEYLQASQGVLQEKRAITLSEENLENIQDADIVFAVEKSHLDLLTPLLVEKLNDSGLGEEYFLGFEGLEFKFNDQSLTLIADITALIEGYNVKAEAQISSFVAATGNGLHWNLYADGITIKKIDGPKGKVTRTMIRTVGNGILSLTPIINAVLDEAVNDDPSSALLVSFDQEGFLEIDLAESNNSEITFQPKVLTTSMQTIGSGVIINKTGMIVAASVEFLPGEVVPPTTLEFPEDAELIRQSKGELSGRISAYQNDLDTIIANSFGETSFYNSGRVSTGFGVSDKALAQLLNLQIAQGAINANIKTASSSKGSSQLTFEIKEKDCYKYFDGCDYQNICSGNRCEQEVSKQVEKACEVQCGWSTGLLGILIPKLCDGLCKETIKIVEPVSSLQCDAFRAADKLHAGALCSIASNVDKAVCDIDANLRKGVCDGVQEIGRFYRANPVATLETESSTDFNLDVSLNNFAFDETLKTLDINLSLYGGGSAKASLDYDRHNYASAAISPALSLGLLCATDWKESISVDVSADINEQTIPFSIRFAEQEDGALDMTFEQIGEKVIFVDFSPSPLAALFGGKPQVTLNCPLAAAGSLIYSSGEAVIKEKEIREVFPLLTGKDYPHTLEKLDFKFKLDPILICENEVNERNNCNDQLPKLFAQKADRGIIYKAR
ncbi:MAG: hypothetical protein AAFR51_13760 [Pseudomonadota bacterium]